MKKNNWQLVLRIFLIVLMIGIGWYFSDKLPDKVPVHWNWQGEVDGFGSRGQGLWTIPIMTVVIMIIFWFVPQLDPKREKYKQFAGVWEMFQSMFLFFMIYVYFISLYAAVAAVDVGSWVMTGVGLLFVWLGNMMGKIRQNYFVGIKVPWTLNNEEVWNKTHRLGGWCFVIAGLLLTVNAWTKILVGPIFILAMTICLVVPIVYSYVIYKKIDLPKK